MRRLVPALLVLSIGVSDTVAQLAPEETVERDLATEEEVAARAQALENLRGDQRSARNAILMTAVVPGWGQLYADAPFWSALAFGVQMYYLGSILMENRRVERQRVLRDAEEPGSAVRETRSQLVDEHKERIRDAVWWASGALLIISLDAYVSVELADFDSPDPPTPDLDRQWDEDGASGAGVALRLNFGF